MAASDQRTARIVGWFFIGTFVFSIPGWLLYGPLLNHHDYILGGGHDFIERGSTVRVPSEGFRSFAG